MLFLFALSGLGFYGLILGGWASGNKYSLLGAARTAAQLVSYEVAMGLSVIGVIMMAQSLSLVDIVHAQQDTVWYILFQPVGFLIFLIAAVAETNRAPFDLPEAESELVAGLPHRVRRPEVRHVLPGRVRQHDHHLGARGHAVPGRLRRAVPARASCG